MNEAKPAIGGLSAIEHAVERVESDQSHLVS